MSDILGISGSLRAASHNTALLRLAAELTAPGQRLRIWDGLDAIPPFNEDHEHDPGVAVAAMRATIQTSDALVVATPEYNTTVPGQLKNALDWLSRPTGEGALAGKPVAVIGASPSAYGARWSQQATRAILHACGANLRGEPLHVAHAHRAFTPKGRLRDEAQHAALARVLRQLDDATPDPDALDTVTACVAPAGRCRGCAVCPRERG